MTDTHVHLYEGLFLFNIQAVEGNLGKAVDHLNEILRRAEADVVALARWDERKLAYPIHGQKRGLYLLAHFNVRGSQIANIERDVNLSEFLLRCLILRADHVGEIELQQIRQEAAKLKDLIALGGKIGETEPAAPSAPAPEAAGGDENDEAVEAGASDDRE